MHLKNISIIIKTVLYSSFEFETFLNHSLLSGKQDTAGQILTSRSQVTQVVLFVHYNHT